MIVIVVFILLIVHEQGLSEKEVATYHQNNGGYNKKFIPFTKLLEEKYNMTLSADTGAMFLFQAAVTYNNHVSGKIGVRVEKQLYEDILCVELFLNNGDIIKGKRIGGWFDDNKKETEFEEYLIMSLGDILAYYKVDWLQKSKTSSSKQQQFAKPNIKKDVESDSESMIVNPFIYKWNSLKQEVRSKPNGGSEICSFIDQLCFVDYIDYDKFLENLDLLEPNKRYLRLVNPKMGTASIRKIDHWDIPPAFNRLFLAAYPDVFVWFQDEFQKGHPSLNEFSHITDENKHLYMDNFGFKISMLKTICKSYKAAGNKFECAFVHT